MKANLKLISKVFLITSVPKTTWSSHKPDNIIPNFKTFFLCFGLFLFGLDENILVISQNGVTPWTVLAEGILGNLIFV